MAADEKNAPPLHLIKLCVGPQSIADLVERQAFRRAEYRAAGVDAPLKHTTRMQPKRKAEMIFDEDPLRNGSLYWVIKGQLCARQRLIDIAPFTDAEGINRCHLLYDDEVVLVSPRPYRPFQGWRYLAAKDAPPDLGQGAIDEEMPEDMRRALAAMGLM